MRYIFGIDPGTIKSAYILIYLDNNNKFYIIDKDHLENNKMIKIIMTHCITKNDIDIVIEAIVSYGMSIGQSTINTAVWIGKFLLTSELLGKKAVLLSRPDIKLNLCYSKRAKDKNVNQRLKDRFGDFGTKKNRGRLYELKEGLVKGGRSHVMSALAVAVTYCDINIGEVK